MIDRWTQVGDEDDSGRQSPEREPAGKTGPVDSRRSSSDASNRPPSGWGASRLDGPSNTGRKLTPPDWSQAEKRLLAVDSHGCGLAVALWRQGDRYAHALFALPGSAEPAAEDRDSASTGSPVLLMASLEGTDRETWPASPPLQQLIVEPREAGREVALLIGMAGSSHWSLSIDVDPISRLIVFEAACRCASQPSELGSRYLTQPGNRSAARELHWNLPRSTGVELLWPESRGLVSEPEPGKSQWMVRPSDMPTDKWPATVRWSYAVRWLGEGHD